MYAAAEGHLDTLQCLLEAKANLEAKGGLPPFCTATECAREEDNPEVVELLMEEELRYKECRDSCGRRIRNAIRKHLPRLAMLHSEVENAVFPLPRDMMKLEIERQHHLDRTKLNMMEEQMNLKLTRKRRREHDERRD
mmetsp:Transcript_5612/g.10314  ORF Transcript_5612/g.10314 Transcript_5612/m.10314 type:complete len:138 (+) Transcript_5612:438-851(+)